MFADVVARKGLAAGGNGGANKSGVIGREEMCLWEEQWLEASMQMNQWEVLEDFAKGVDHVNLLMECQWRSGNWASLKEGVLSRAAPEEPERLCVVKAYFALASDGDPNNSMYFFEQGMHAALRKWWQLPELIVQPHLNMLHLFQIMVEMQESARMLVELHSARRYIDNPEFIAHNLKEIEVKLDQKLEVWRMRMPNEWDGLPWWSEVLQWRHHVYNVVIRTFDKCENSNPHLHQVQHTYTHTHSPNPNPNPTQPSPLLLESPSNDAAVARACGAARAASKTDGYHSLLAFSP
jgi:transformation/transcription domain-associated protein